MTQKSKMFERTLKEMDLMERHLKMLKATKENQPVGIIRLSEILDLPKHKVRYSLRLLEQDGLIAATGDGAMITEKYDEFVSEISIFLKELSVKMEELGSEIPK